MAKKPRMATPAASKGVKLDPGMKTILEKEPGLKTTLQQIEK